MDAEKRLELCQDLLNKATVAHNRASQLDGHETGATKYSGTVPKSENDRLLKEFDDSVTEIKGCVAKL